MKTRVDGIDTGEYSLFDMLDSGFFSGVAAGPSASLSSELDEDHKKLTYEDLLHRQEEIHTLARNRVSEALAKLLNGRDIDLYGQLILAAQKGRTSRSGVAHELFLFLRRLFRTFVCDKQRETETQEEANARFMELLVGLLGEDISKHYEIMDPKSMKFGTDITRCSRVEEQMRGKTFLLIRDCESDLESEYARSYYVVGIKNYGGWYYMRADKSVTFCGFEGALVFEFLLKTFERKSLERLEYFNGLSEAEQGKYLSMLKTLGTDHVDEETAAGLEPWEKEMFAYQYENKTISDYKVLCRTMMKLYSDLLSSVRAPSVFCRGVYDIPICHPYIVDGFLAWFDFDVESGVVKQYRSERKGAGSHRATSYETKKNIPQKTLGKMEELSAEGYFGYVEIDEDCDLNSVSTIYDEIKAFCATYLPKLKLSDAELRFRRLGNHKAAGLYYPTLNCLCVDINSPGSFIHELGHLIDTTSGRLSERGGFSVIRNTYAKLFREKVRQERIKLTGKYDADYYLEPTEIFARCFEMYVSGFTETDICKRHDSQCFAYPKASELETRIKQYFDRLLKDLGYGAEQETA